MAIAILEAQVQEVLQHSLKQYHLLHQLADRMLNENLPPEQWQESADRMKQISEQLELAEQNNRTLISEYGDSQPESTTAVSALKEQLATQMQNFLMKIMRLEQQAQRSRDALLPQIHASLRAVQMKNAYGKYA